MPFPPMSTLIHKHIPRLQPVHTEISAFILDLEQVTEISYEEVGFENLTCGENEKNAFFFCGF